MPEHHTVVASIHGFHLLPVTFPALPSLPSTATHFLYVAAHEPQIPTKTTPRSLFIVNVPIDATDHHIRHLLSSQLDLPHGRIEEITFEKSKHRGNINTAESNSVAGHPRGKKRKRGSYPRPVQILEESRLPSTWDRELQTNGGSAVVTFVDKASMDTVLKVVAKTIKSKKEIVWGQGLEVDLPKLGSARYLNHEKLQYPDKSALLNSVNDYMTAFAAQEAAQARSQARQRSEPDADGFVTVTRGGRTDPGRQAAAQAVAGKHKEKQHGLENFYRFQTREKKKARAGELIRKFEEDKERIRKMKEQRGKFRPE